MHNKITGNLMLKLSALSFVPQTLAIVLFISLILPSQAQEVAKPTFDCTKAQQAVEVTICSDPELAELDVELLGTYKKLAASKTDLTQLKASQRAWLKKRNACDSAECIAKSYRGRLAQLKERLQPRNDTAKQKFDGAESSEREIYQVAPPPRYDGVNLRSKPLTEAPVLTSFPRGTIVALVEKRSDNWWRVRHVQTGQEGWVRSEVKEGATLVPTIEEVDCETTADRVEKLVCGSERLRVLNTYMLGALRFAGLSNPVVMQSQKEWLRSREKCQDVECLAEMYKQRETALNDPRTFLPKETEKEKNEREQQEKIDKQREEEATAKRRQEEERSYLLESVSGLQCPYARAPITQKICDERVEGSDELFDLQSKLSQALIELNRLASPDDWSRHEEAQINWIREREACGDRECIVNVYSYRLDEVSSQVKQTAEKVADKLAKDGDLLFIFDSRAQSAQVSRNLNGELEVGEPTREDICVDTAYRFTVQDDVEYKPDARPETDYAKGYHKFISEIVAQRMPTLKLDELGDSTCSYTLYRDPNEMASDGGKFYALYVMYRKDLEHGLPPSTEIIFTIPEKDFARFKDEREAASARLQAQSLSMLAEVRQGRLVGAGTLIVSDVNVMCAEPSGYRFLSGISFGFAGEDAKKYLPSGYTVNSLKLEESFKALKANQCGAFFGEASSIRKIADGLERDGRSASLGPNWISEQEMAQLSKSITDGEEREQKEQEAARKKEEEERIALAEEEARCNADTKCREEQERAAAQARAALPAYNLSVTCLAGGNPILVHACFSGGSTYAEGNLSITSDGNSRVYSLSELVQLSRGTSMALPLSENFEIFAQPNGNTNFVLNVEIYDRDGNRVFQKQSSNYQPIAVSH